MLTKMATSHLKLTCRYFSLKQHLINFMNNFTPTNVIKYSIIPQTLLTIPLFIFDPATQIYRTAAITIPLLITGHTMMAVGARLTVGGNAMGLSSEFLSTGLLCTSVFGIIAFHEVPLLLCLLNCVQ